MPHLLPVHDADRAALFHGVTAAVLDHDQVHLPADPLDELLPLLSWPDVAGTVTEIYLVVEDDEPVATLSLSIPTLDNLENVSAEVRVHPDQRRRGLGTWTWQQALARVQELRRTRVVGEVPSPVDSPDSRGAAFAARVGARPVLHEVRRVLDMTTAPPLAPVIPDGYRLEQWVDTAPEELVDELARLAGRMTTDAPLGEMDWEAEVWDAARYRAKEDDAKARRRLRVATAAVHESGTVAGVTDIGVSRPAPVVGYQWDTIVDPDHRGHGLGLVLKAANHALLRQESPQTRWVNTWNADSNSFMVAINETLGFVPVDRWTEWQLDL